MRCAVLFTSLLLLSIVPLSTNVTAEGIDSDTGVIIMAEFNESTEITNLTITAPQTNDSILLDEFRTSEIHLFRIASERDPNGTWSGYGNWELIENITLCSRTMLNSECSGNTFQMEIHPPPGYYFVNYVLTTAMPPSLIEPDGAYNDNNSWYQYYVNNPPITSSNHYLQSLPGPTQYLYENISLIESVENLSANYSNGVTDLTWDYPTGLDMNHSIMIYSHDSPATRENWSEMPKTIVSSSVPAGTTSYQINHSSSSVERDIYYSVTLLYPTSEDTRFLGSNTLSSPVWEDNVAPLFIGELSAIFDVETGTTTIDWEEGVQDDDLTINIYRSSIEPGALASNTLVATVDAAQSSYEIEVPFGEHRQSWYAITLEDSQGNEIMELTESSPVSDPVIESTISTTTISGIDTERYADGTVAISWNDNTNNPIALAKVWRSTSGPIDSLDDVEELGITNHSSEQFLHNPLNAQDEAWYAVTIVAAWGSEQNPWHDERLFTGVNSLSQPLRETDEEVEEVVVSFTSSVMTTTGQRANLSDGSMVSLGAMNEGDMIIISTSSTVTNISCQDINGEGTSINSQSDWALSFSANQSGEKCLGLIVNGDEEIGFILTWNYIETIVEDDDDDDERAGEERDDKDERDSPKSRDGDGMETVATVILTIVILALIVYLLVMMRTPEYSEEEE